MIRLAFRSTLLLRGAACNRQQTRGYVYSGKDKMLMAADKSKSKYSEYVDFFRQRSSKLSEEASVILNQITGYDECEKLRNAVVNADKNFQIVKDEFRKSRLEFDQAMQARSQCQKELNALLQRKQAWVDEDLLRFTELYRTEMRLEASEAEARVTNERLDIEVDRAHQTLMDTLRERYQEEQLWSDKIRRISTFGTFALMGLNLVLFLMIQLYLEPKKREKFILQFENVIAQRVDDLRHNIEQNISAHVGHVQRIDSIERSRTKVFPHGYDDATKGLVAGAAAVLIWQAFFRLIFAQG